MNIIDLPDMLRIAGGSLQMSVRRFRILEKNPASRWERVTLRGIPGPGGVVGHAHDRMDQPQRHRDAIAEAIEDGDEWRLVEISLHDGEVTCRDIGAAVEADIGPDEEKPRKPGEPLFFPEPLHGILVHWTDGTVGSAGDLAMSEDVLGNRFAAAGAAIPHMEAVAGFMLRLPAPDRAEIAPFDLRAVIRYEKTAEDDMAPGA